MSQIENNKMGHDILIWSDDYNAIIRILIENKECLAHSLFVREDLRNKGKGTSLIKEAETLVFGKGYDKIYLYVKKNSLMYNWYKRLGYLDTKEKCENGYIKMVKNYEYRDTQNSRP